MRLIFGILASLLYLLFLAEATTADTFELPEAENLQTERFGDGDLIAFWAGAQLFIQGRNPYNQSDVLQLQQTQYTDRSSVQAFLSPPWALPILAAAFLTPDLNTARQLWILANFLFFIASIFIWIKFLDTKKPELFTGDLAVLVSSSFLFLPFVHGLFLGQLSIFLLVVLLGGLLLLKKGRSIEAGILLSLLCMKPHLFLPIGLVIVLTGIKQRDWAFLAALLVACLFWVTLPAIWVPGIYQMWQENTFDATLYRTGTFVTMIRAMDLYFTGTLSTYPLILFPVLGAIAALWLFTHEANLIDSPRQIELLLFISIAFAPYAWFYDYVLLLPIQLSILISVAPEMLRKKRWIRLMFILLLVQILPFLLGDDLAYSLIMIPALFLLWFLARPLALNQSELTQ